MTLRRVALFPLLLLAACQALSPAGRGEAPEGPAAPEARQLSLAPRFVVDPAASEIRLLVHRAGPLARFGHNHVIIGRVRGEIRVGATAAASGFRLEIPVASFEVDPAAARAEEGKDFSSAVSDEARQGTRENMLGERVLDASRYPLIRIETVSLVGPRWNPTVVARTTLRGTIRELRFPASVMENGDHLTVIASFAVRQSDFGIEPFSAFGGGLRVADVIHVRIRLAARRAKSAGRS